jgi:hypothetical protein
MAILQEGREPLVNARSSILLQHGDMSCADHKFRQRTAKAIVDTLGQFDAMECAEQIEIS